MRLGAANQEGFNVLGDVDDILVPIFLHIDHGQKIVVPNVAIFYQCLKDRKTLCNQCI